MSDVVMRATREGYGEGLVELYKKRKDMVVLDADLASATKTAMFEKSHPDKFFNCGIAEANMIGVAAGLATTGKPATSKSAAVPRLVFASSFAMFAAGRAFEQIRNSIAYPNLNVKIGATHGGISVGEDGASHQCNEDIALMRVLPNMTIINPADSVEARAAVLAMAEHNGPVYMRFGRLAVPVFNDRETYKFQLGKGLQLREGTDVTIIATGLLVAQALEAHDILAGQGISARVINIHTIKPIDAEIIAKAAKETGRIITVEEHSVIGGLGDAVCSVLAEAGSVPVKKIGIEDRFGYSGPALELLKEFGLCSENIVKVTKEFCGK
ncbi:MAG: transketolase family protein [Oscillospiraceae bacterium]|nr:transketolase family protein [Oscillospiraceae bacterium]